MEEGWDSHKKPVSVLGLSRRCACGDVCVRVFSRSVVSNSDRSPPGSSVHGIAHARILQWVAIFYSRGSSQPRDQIYVSCISCIGQPVLYHCATWEAPWEMHMSNGKSSMLSWLGYLGGWGLQKMTQVYASSLS